jgi:putative transposase
MAKLSQTDLPDCWILDRGTIKWQRKTYAVVGVMDLLSRKVLAWDLVRPLKPKPVAQVLATALTVYGKPPALVVGIDAVFSSPELQTIYSEQAITPIDLRQGKVSVTVFIRSLWRNLHWEGLSLEEPMDEAHFRQLAATWFDYYNRERIHQALDYDVPDERWRSARYQV